MFAWDYSPGWAADCPSPSQTLLHAKQQADKHVAHITTERRGVNQPGTAQESKWNLQAIVQEIAGAMALFMSNAPASNFNPNELTKMKGRLTAFPVGGPSGLPVAAMSGPQIHSGALGSLPPISTVS